MNHLSKNKRLAPTSSVTPVAVDVDLIRFEKNLLQIGFFGANDARDKGRTTRRVEQTVIRDGHKVRVAAEFRGSDALGLPSTTDRDKFIALLKIISEERAKTGSIANPVRFSGYRLIQELGIARNGEVYDEILRWGKRMTDTTITSERVVFRAARKVYTDETLHVFRAFRRTGNSKIDGTDRQESYEVVLEDWLLENLNQRYVVPEDFNAYKALTRPTAKGIFGNLHLWFHASAGKPVEKNYADLCNLLNIQAYPHLSKIKSTMGLALDELVSIKYVSKWDVLRMSSKDGFKIVLHPGDELLNILDTTRRDRRLSSPANDGADRASEPEASPVINEEGYGMAVQSLRTHGVLPRKAEQLVTQYGSQHVREVVSYFETNSFVSSSSRVHNPAGLLVHSLEQGFTVPEAHKAQESRRALDAAREQKQLDAARSGIARQEDERIYFEWVENKRKDLLRDIMTDEEFEERLQLAVQDKVRTDIRFRRMTAALRAEVVRRGLIRELTASLGVPSFAEWQRHQSQTNLF